MSDNHPEIMVSIQRAADYTGLSYYCVRKLCQDNEIPYIRSGRKYCVNLPKLVEYLGQIHEPVHSL